MLKGKKSRVLAWVMTLVLLLGLVVTPTSTYADGSATTVADGSEAATELPGADSNGVITLTGNVSLDSLTIDSATTIELAGYTVTLTGGITLNADLTVKDSSSSGTGVITNASTGNDLITVNKDDITVMVESGTLKAGCDGIYSYNHSNVSVVMNGGKITTAESSYGNDGIHILYGSNNSVTVNSGVIDASASSSYSRIAIEFYGVTNPVVALNGGYFKQGNTSCGLVRGAIVNLKDGYEWQAASGEYGGYYTVAAYNGSTVATVNGTGYATLRAAFAAAEDGDTVTLAADYTMSQVVGIGYQCGAEVVGKSITFDLNGHTLTVDSTAGGNNFALIYVHTGAALTLVDSNEAGTGKIDIQTSSTYAVRNCGTFTMNSGTITSVGYGIESKPYYYYCYSDAQIAAYVSTVTTINGGTITGGSSSQVLRVDNATDCTAALTINDVTFTGKIYLSGTSTTGVTAVINGGSYTSGSTSGSVIEINNGTSLTINDGTFQAAEGSYSSTDLISIMSNGGTLVINDGTFTAADAVVAVSNSSSSKNYTVELNGGVYTSETKNIVYVSNSTSNTTSVTVTGGTYNADVNSYVATDYSVDTSSDGEEVVYYTVTSKYDASIGNTKYEKLADAFSAATDGDTIKVLRDVTITSATYNGDGYYQVSGKEVTLDLGGYTLSVDTTRILGVKNSGTLNVKNGTIEIADGTSSTYKQFNMVRGSSTFTATNVTFDANNIGTYAVYIASDSTTTATVALTDCTFTDVTNAIVFDAGNTSTVTLTGCSYVKQPFSTSAFSTVGNYTVVITENSPSSGTYEANNSYALFFNYVVEDGGTIETDSTVTVKSYYGDASLTVNDGGTVKANIKVNDDTSMTVIGGTVTGTITVAAEGATEENAILTASAEKYDITGGLLTISGGTITGQVKSSGTLIMTGGNVTDGGTGYSDGVIFILNGNVYVEGGTVTGTARGFGFASSGTIGGTISGGSITGSDIALMVRPNSFNSVKVSGGSFAATNALYLANESETSTIFADGYSAYNTEDTALTSTLSGTVTLYKSALSDKTVIVAVSGAVCKNSTTGTLYASLSDAVSAASNGDTVTLLASVTEDVVIESGKNITLDLAGYSITAKSSHAIANYGTLTIEDSSATAATEDSAAVAGTGKVIATVGSTAALYNQGEVVLNGGTFTRSSGQWYTVVNQGSDSKMTFNSPVVVETSSDVDNTSSMIRNYGGTMTINGGTFTSDSLSCIKNEPNSTLTISGGTITNKAESASKKQGAIINAGTVTVSGGTINSYSSAIFGTSSSYPGTVSITGGTFNNLNTNVASALIGSYQYNTETEDKMYYITGGTFNGYSIYPKYLASDKYSLLYNYNASDSYSSWKIVVSDDTSDWTTYEAKRETTYGTVYLTDADAAFNTTYFGSNTGTVYLYAALDSVTDVAVNTTGYTLVLMNKILSTDAGDYTSHFTCASSTGYALLSKTGTVDVDGETYNTVTIYQAVTESSANASITINDETTYYATLGAAITAANSISTDTDVTIVVQGDHSYSGIPTPTRSMTIDLNGKAYTGTSSYGVIKLATEGITVTVTDSVGGGSMGRVSASTKLCTLTAGTLELTSGTYTGTFTSVTTGTLKITGGTYTSDPKDYLAGGCYEVTNDDSTFTVRQLVLGASGDSDETTTSVSATSISGYGTSTLYVGVSASDISKYSTTNYPTTSLTYTVEDGNTTDSGSYIFAGWYTLADGSYTACTAIPTTDAYAKFVDANTLSVSCFFTPYDDKNALRFFTSQTDVLSDAGFELYIDNTLVENAITSVTYHASSYSVGGTQTSPLKTYTPASFSSASNAVVTGRYYDTSKATSFSVVPYWVTKDGTKICGEKVYYTCSGITSASVLTSSDTTSEN